MSSTIWLCLILLVFSTSSYARPKASPGPSDSDDGDPLPPRSVHMLHHLNNMQFAATKAIQDASQDAQQHLAAMKLKNMELIRRHFYHALAPVPYIKERLDTLGPSWQLPHPPLKNLPGMPLPHQSAHAGKPEPCWGNLLNCLHSANSPNNGAPEVHKCFGSNCGRFLVKPLRRPIANVNPKPLYMGPIVKIIPSVGQLHKQNLCNIPNVPLNSYLHFQCNHEIPFFPTHATVKFTTDLNKNIATVPAKNTDQNYHQITTSSPSSIAQNTNNPQHPLTLPEKLYNKVISSTDAYERMTKLYELQENILKLENEILGIDVTDRLQTGTTTTTPKPFIEAEGKELVNTELPTKQQNQSQDVFLSSLESTSLASNEGTIGVTKPVDITKKYPTATEATPRDSPELVISLIDFREKDEEPQYSTENTNSDVGRTSIKDFGRILDGVTEVVTNVFEHIEDRKESQSFSRTEEDLISDSATEKLSKSDHSSECTGCNIKNSENNEKVFDQTTYGVNNFGDQNTEKNIKSPTLDSTSTEYFQEQTQRFQTSSESVNDWKFGVTDKELNKSPRLDTESPSQIETETHSIDEFNYESEPNQVSSVEERQNKIVENNDESTTIMLEGSSNETPQLRENGLWETTMENLESLYTRAATPTTQTNSEELTTKVNNGLGFSDSNDLAREGDLFELLPTSEPFTGNWKDEEAFFPTTEASIGRIHVTDKWENEDNTIAILTEITGNSRETSDLARENPAQTKIKTTTVYSVTLMEEPKIESRTEEEDTSTQINEMPQLSKDNTPLELISTDSTFSEYWDPVTKSISPTEYIDNLFTVGSASSEILKLGREDSQIDLSSTNAATTNKDLRDEMSESRTEEEDTSTQITQMPQLSKDNTPLDLISTDSTFSEYWDPVTKSISPTEYIDNLFTAGSASSEILKLGREDSQVDLSSTNAATTNKDLRDEMSESRTEEEDTSTQIEELTQLPRENIPHDQISTDSTFSEYWEPVTTSISSTEFTENLFTTGSLSSEIFQFGREEPQIDLSSTEATTTNKDLKDEMTESRVEGDTFTQIDELPQLPRENFDLISTVSTSSEYWEPVTKSIFSTEFIDNLITDGSVSSEILKLGREEPEIDFSSTDAAITNKDLKEETSSFGPVEREEESGVGIFTDLEAESENTETSVRTDEESLAETRDDSVLRPREETDFETTLSNLLVKDIESEPMSEGDVERNQATEVDTDVPLLRTEDFVDGTESFDESRTTVWEVEAEIPRIDENIEISLEQFNTNSEQTTIVHLSEITPSRTITYDDSIGENFEGKSDSALISDENWTDFVEQPESAETTPMTGLLEMGSRIEDATEHQNNYNKGRKLTEQISLETLSTDITPARQTIFLDNSLGVTVPSPVWKIDPTLSPVNDKPEFNMQSVSDRTKANKFSQNGVVKYTTEIENETNDNVLIVGDDEESSNTPTFVPLNDEPLKKGKIESEKMLNEVLYPTTECPFCEKGLKHGQRLKRSNMPESTSQTRIMHLNEEKNIDVGNENTTLPLLKPHSTSSTVMKTENAHVKSSKNLKNSLSINQDDEDLEAFSSVYASTILELLPVIREGCRNNAFSKEDKKVIQSIFGDIRALMNEEQFELADSTSELLMGDETSKVDDTLDDSDYDSSDAQKDKLSERLKRSKKNLQLVSGIIRKLPIDVKREFFRLQSTKSSRKTRSSGAQPVSAAAAILALLAEDSEVQLDRPDDEDDDEYEYYEDDEYIGDEYDNRDDYDNPSFKELILLAKKHREQKAIQS